MEHLKNASLSESEETSSEKPRDFWRWKVVTAKILSTVDTLAWPRVFVIGSP
jgi:hypothetical protein